MQLGIKFNNCLAQNIFEVRTNKRTIYSSEFDFYEKVFMCSLGILDVRNELPQLKLTLEIKKKVSLKHGFKSFFAGNKSYQFIVLFAIVLA